MRPGWWPARSILAVTEYRGGRDAALSFTFDDGLQSQVDWALPILEEAGFRATLFLIAGLTRERRGDPYLPGTGREFAGVSWEEWREIAGRGHEVGNHSLTHPALHRVGREQLEREVREGQRLIAERTGQTVVSFAFPYFKTSRAAWAVAQRFHLAARKSGVTYGGPGFTVALANHHVELALRERTWLVPVLHGIEEGHLPVTREFLREHVRHISARSGALWVAPYGVVARYRQEREDARLRLLEEAPGRVSFRLEDRGKRPGPAEALTVAVRTAPAFVKEAHASRAPDGEALPVVIQPDRLLVDAVPGPGAITIAWQVGP